MSSLADRRRRTPPARPKVFPFTVRDRVTVIDDVSWATYLHLDKELYDGRRRVSFCDGKIQIMSVSDLHELIKTNLRCMVEAYCFLKAIPWSGRGQATRRLLDSRAGEPDESYIFTEGAEFPDVVLEIALSSSGINKLTFWSGFPVTEVWIWRKERLEIHRWNGEAYEIRNASEFVPGLDIALLEKNATRRDTFAMLTEFRGAVA